MMSTCLTSTNCFITTSIYGIPQTFLSDISDSETELSTDSTFFDAKLDYECEFLNEEHVSSNQSNVLITRNSTNNLNLKANSDSNIDRGDDETSTLIK